MIEQKRLMMLERSPDIVALRRLLDPDAHSDLVNGFWDEFESRHQTQQEEHPWKLKYYVALAFVEGVEAGLRHAKAEKD